MTSLLKFDRRASSVVEARARAHDYAALSVFPGRP
jgi:hypothetical protein